MPDDPRVLQLIEEMLDSGSSAEEVCRDTPELLQPVLEGWRKFRALEIRIDDLFPEPGSAGEVGALLPENPPPRIPGYELTGVVGRGGVGVVYKAEHLGLNRTVALKMLLAGAFATRAERQRFAREAELVAGLRHPNIVQVYDVGDLDGRPYFTMEFVERGSLADSISGTPQPARQAAELVATLADAIAAAHAGGVVHRDLKPSNVLLTADGTPKVSDFGLARRLEVGSSLTLTGATMGTPSYMAPEQARGQGWAIGPAVDVYALGAILYELLTGRPPFRAETPSETVQQVIDQDPAPPSRLNAKVPRDLETICLKCLHKDPRQRYADGDALAEDLRRFLRGEAIAARPENALQRLARRVRRRPALSASITAGALLAPTLIGAGLWVIQDRAGAVQRAAGERAALESAADDDLRQMERLLEASAWPEAAAAMERAKVRLVNRGSAELRLRLDQGARELELVARLDAIRLDRITTAGSDKHIAARLDGNYQAAFAGAGLGRGDEAPGVVAAKVNSSRIRGALLNAIDDWATSTGDDGLRKWLLSVARLADPDPTEWRDRARDPANLRERPTLEALIADAPVADRCVPLFLSLAKQANNAGVDSVPFLRKVQQAHPGDLYANLVLAANVLARDPGEAVRYNQAAVAIRPDASVARNNFGVALGRVGRFEEAADQYRMAMQLNPAEPQFLRNLVFTLHLAGRHDEVIEKMPIVLRDFPEYAMVHHVFGLSLEAKGRFSEAVAEFQRAASLDPKLRQARYGVRNGLLRMGRWDEARVVWGAALADDPPEHDPWHGYAEFCLFLGQEDEYRRIRLALLSKFGTSTDPHVSYCTGLACLLRPAADEDMRRILALAARAWNADRSKYQAFFAHFQFLQGLAEFRQGRLDRAIALTQGDAASALGPAPRLVIAMALHQDGRLAEARKTLAAAILSYDWRATEARDHNAWICHLLRREAEGMILPNLSVFLDGKYQPQDNDERLALLGVCQFEGRWSTAARLYAEAFEADPKLAEGQNAQDHYAAACFAALAGSGRSDDGAAGESERARWRRQARDWLRADLGSMRRLLDGNDPASRQSLQISLKRWADAPDLAGLRDSWELEKLPPPERQECRDLWRDHDALLKRAVDPK